MSLTAIVLILISAVMHAGWNLFSKRQSPSTSFFLISSIVGVILFSPFPILHFRVLADIPGRVWGLVAGTGLCLAVYYAGLAGAYRSGNMSIAYPLARSSPIIVVALVTTILGRGDQVSRLCAAGIVLVVIGCFLLPMHRFGEFRPRHYLNATCGLALLAAFGTAGYSILDDEALRVLRSYGALGLGTTRVTLLYAFFEVLSCVLWLGLGMAVSRVGPRRWACDWRTDWKPAMVAGVTIWTGYVLILLSMAFVRNVSYVAAFRQLSIPLGTALGILVLKEPAPAPKMVGVAVIFLGLLLVAGG